MSGLTYVLEDRFQHALCDPSGQGAVRAISERAKGHLSSIRRLSVSTSYLEQMISEHTAVVAAFAQRDVARADEALRHRLGMVPSELPRIRRDHSEVVAEP